MSRPFRIALLGTVAAVLVTLPLLVFAVARALNNGEIAPNVMVGDVHVGGLDPDSATELVSDYEERLRTEPAPFVVKGRMFELDPGLVSFDIDETQAIEAAMEVRRQGGFCQRDGWFYGHGFPFSLSVAHRVRGVPVDGNLAVL